jgi:hypothetical protein
MRAVHAAMAIVRDTVEDPSLHLSVRVGVNKEKRS